MNYNNLSSWRTTEKTCKQGVTEIDFLDTKPNQFVIQNPNDVSLHCSISKIPTMDSYEYFIPKNTTQVVGRPMPTSKLYIYNPVEEEVHIKIFSVYETFNVEILKNPIINLDGAEVKTDGLVKGFAEGVTLPSGTNSLGKVELDSQTMQFFGSNLGGVGSMMGQLLSKVDTSSADNNKIWKFIQALLTDEINIENPLDPLADPLVNLARLEGALETISSNVATYVRRNTDNMNALLSVEEVSHLSGTYVKGFTENTTFNTNNWFDMWKSDSKYCFKVSDFTTDQECEITAPLVINGKSSSQSIVCNISIIMSYNKYYIRCSNDIEMYPTYDYELAIFKDINGKSYFNTYDLFWNLIEYISDVKGVSTPSLGNGLMGVNFSVSKRIYTFETIAPPKTREYSGAWSCLPKVIKTPSQYNGVYTITTSDGINVNCPITTETNPVRIMDKIECISNLGDKDLTVKLFYDFANYIEMIIPAHSNEKDINMPIYNIGVKVANYEEGITGKISIYGGLF